MEWKTRQNSESIEAYPLLVIARDAPRQPPSPSPSNTVTSSTHGSLPYGETKDTTIKQSRSRLQRWFAVMHNSRGLLILSTGQFFAALMSLITRYLSTSLPSARKYTASQILLVRMIATVTACVIWMWYSKVPHFPFGRKDVRWLLILRGCAGFGGVYGLFSSLAYLPLPDSTIITFLVPMCVGFICSMIPSLKEPFTTVEKLAGLVSLVGVTLIARPTFLFNPSLMASAPTSLHVTRPGGISTPVTAPERFLGVCASLIGVLCAAVAISTIRVIGKRAHPLISVTYFSTLTGIISFLSLIILPKLTGGIRIPQTSLEWILLGGIGVSGFLNQLCLTKGLQLEKAGRGSSLIYLQILWAMLFEWLVWGDVVDRMSLVGGVLIFLGLAGVNFSKWKGEREEGEVMRQRDADEEAVRLRIGGGGEEGEREDGYADERERD